MNGAKPTKADIYYYFTHLNDEFQDDHARFEANWRGIENAGFSIDDLTEIAKQTSRFLVPNFNRKDVRGAKRTAMQCVQGNLSCWEGPAFAHLEAANRPPSLYNLVTMGESLDRLLEEALPQRFADLWQEHFFKALNTKRIDTRFINGLKAIAGMKDRDRLSADLSDDNKVRMMELIEAYAEHLEAEHISDLIYALNKLNIVPKNCLQTKIMNRAADIMREQVEAEAKGLPSLKDQRFYERGLGKFIFGSTSMIMDWPEQMFEDFKTLAKKHIRSPAESARTLHGLGMLYAKTRDDKYKKFAKQFYNDVIKDAPLLDKQKRQVFDACYAMDIPTDIKRPAEDTKVGGETSYTEYFNEIGVQTSDQLLILQGTGHKVDIKLLTEDAKRAVGIEFDGPGHFHIYFNHKDPSKTHRIYNGETLMQMLIAEKSAPDAVIVRIPHSAKLARTEEEAEFIRAIVEKAMGDSKGRNKPAGIYIAHAREGRGIILKPTRPANDDGPMRHYPSVHF